MTFGERLKAERQRLKMTQVEFGEAGGVVKFTQLNYEKETASPSVDYLLKLEAIGVDIVYVLTGRYMVAVESKANPAEDKKPADPKTERFMARFLSLAPDAQQLVAKMVEMLTSK